MDPGAAQISGMQRLLILLGIILLALGLAWPLLARLGLGRLPGDVVYRQGGVSFYFPIVTCILVSLVLSLLLWLINR
jgi:Protein of unknown function (DUF2905)